MSPPRPFTKFHGIGNDFILIDAREAGLPAVGSERARILCDRRHGIGADGVLEILPPMEKSAHARMRVTNADGSVPEMCGNGIRCVAKYLGDRNPALREDGHVNIETDAGVLRCELHSSDGCVESVRVCMGPASFEPESLPLCAPGPMIDAPLPLSGGPHSGTAVSMGNPHFVLFRPSTTRLEAEARSLGPLIERHALFPNRTNVELAFVDGHTIEVWVWERGCGITLACGTGACATVAAAVMTQRVPADTPIAVHLPGGTLSVAVAADFKQVWMQGPATEVFRGTLPA